MKELRRISFVQWFLFEALDIDVEGDIAIIGSNGSGKSSILDAVQTVLTGGMKRHLRFNASAQQENRSKRTLRSYCLGITASGEEGKEEEEGTRLRAVRPAALTWLSLGFVDRQTGRPVTVGLCLSASVEQNDESFEGGFIADGALLSTEDFLETIDGQRQSRSFGDLVQDLRRRDDITPHQYGTAERYVSQMLRSLSPPHSPIDRDRFLRTFRKAISFRPSDSTTQFTRDFVLDESLVEIADLRRSIAVYKDIRARLEELRYKSERVKALQTLVRNIGEAERSAAARRWELARQEWGWERGRLRAALLDRLRVEQEQAVRAAAADRHDAAAEVLRDRIDERQRARFQSEPEQRIRKLQGDKEIAQTTKGGLSNRMQAWQMAVTDAARIQPFLVEPSVRDELLAWMSQCEAASGPFDRPDWPADPRAIDALARDVSPLRQAMEHIDRQRQDVLGHIALTDKMLKTIRTNLERVAGGRTRLDEAVLDLLDLLDRHAIAATPICDLVDSVEADWRAAIEAALGGNVQALVVAPHEAAEALSLYRRAADTLYGARIVNTRKTDQTRSPLLGSAAGVVATTDRHARAFLDHHLGGVLLVDTEEELLRHDSALTRDRMIARGRATLRLPMPRHLLFGRGSREETQRRLESELDQEQRRLKDLTDRSRQLKNAEDLISRAVESLRRAAENTSCADLRRELARIDEHLRRLDDDILKAREDLDPEAEKETRELTQQRERERKAAVEARDLLQKLNRQWGEVSEVIRRHQAERGRWLGERRERLAATRTAGGLALVAELLGRYRPAGDAEELGRIRQEQGDLIHQHERQAQSARQRFAGELAAFAAAFSATFPFEVDAPLHEKADWIIDTLQVLDRFDLPELEKKSGEAHATFLHAFKTDFVGKMTGQFHKVEQTLDELNKALAKRDFNGERYSFEKMPAKRFADLILLIDRARDPDFDLPLFTSHDPQDPLARAAALVEKIVTGDGDVREFEDPRNYFEYELYIKDETGARKSSLAQRAATGSGGEYQVPLYVSMAAALAATYQDRLRRETGLALAVFDEAFNRLDVRNLQQCSGFLRDLGLQTVLAAPDEKHAVFLAEVDCLVSLLRLGDHVDVHVEFPSARTRDTLRREDPRRQGIEGFRAAQQAAVVMP